METSFDKLIYFICRLIRVILDFLALLINVCSPSHSNYLPPITDELLLKPAVELADLIKSGKVSFGFVKIQISYKNIYKTNFFSQL